MSNQKVILFPFQTKGGRVFVESYDLPAKGDWPEKSFKAICFYNLDENKIDRFNLSVDEFSSVKWLDDSGQEIGQGEISLFFASISEGFLPVVEMVFEPKSSGRYTVNTLVEIRFLKDVLGGEKLDLLTK